MRRRSFLAAALTVLAGCSTLRQRLQRIRESGENGDNTPGTRSPTQTLTETALPTSTSPTATRTATETRTGTPTETQTPPETESPTPTETPPAEGNTDLARRAMRRAVEDIKDTLEHYQSYQDGATSILDVTAATPSFSWTAVGSRLDKAREDLDEAVKLGSNPQVERANKLREVAEFIQLTARTQKQLIDAVSNLQKAVDFLYDNSLTTADAERNNMVTHVETATKRLGDIDEEIDPTVLDTTDALDRSIYDEKTAQFQAEIDSLEVIDQDFDTLVSAMRTFAEGVDSYESNAYEDATTEFFNAQGSFDNAESVFENHDPAESLKPQVEEFVCVAAAMSEGSGLMAQSAAAGDNNNRERREERKGAAMDAFSECDTVMNEVEPVKRLQD